MLHVILQKISVLVVAGIAPTNLPLIWIEMILVVEGSASGGVSECLCIETFSANCLGFHNTPNTLLHDIVTELQDQHLLEAVSSG